MYDDMIMLTCVLLHYLYDVIVSIDRYLWMVHDKIPTKLMFTNRYSAAFSWIVQKPNAAFIRSTIYINTSVFYMYSKNSVYSGVSKFLSNYSA